MKIISEPYNNIIFDELVGSKRARVIEIALGVYRDVEPGRYSVEDDDDNFFIGQTLPCFMGDGSVVIGKAYACVCFREDCGYVIPFWGNKIREAIEMFRDRYTDEFKLKHVRQEVEPSEPLPVQA